MAVRLFKPAVFIACAAPAAVLIYRLCQVLLWDMADALGVDPIKTLEHQTGLTALSLLFITLTITPARRISGWNRLQTVRRMLGVWAFVYAVCHLSVYLIFDRNCIQLATCDFAEIRTDILKRKFIFAGMLSFSIMAVLAATSTTGWVRRLKKRWTTLHRAVYIAAIAAVAHYIWIQKSNIKEPLVWAAMLTVLLGARVFFALTRRRESSRQK